MRPPPAILILAAGASRRMRGDDKLLQEIDGTPLILRAVRAACAAAAEVIVTLPANDRSRRAWLGDTPALLVDVADRAMSASIRSGVAVCGADAVMIHLADMPEIGTEEMARMVEAWQRSDAATMQATAEDGSQGQPVIFHRSLFPRLSALTGDTGARSVLERHPPQHVALPGRRALTDLDTPEDWARWRAARQT